MVNSTQKRPRKTRIPCKWGEYDYNDDMSIYLRVYTAHQRRLRAQRMKTASQAQRGPRLRGSSASSASNGWAPRVVRPAGFELAGRSDVRA